MLETARVHAANYSTEWLEGFLSNELGYNMKLSELHTLWEQFFSPPSSFNSSSFNPSLNGTLVTLEVVTRFTTGIAGRLGVFSSSTLQMVQEKVLRVVWRMMLLLWVSWQWISSLLFSALLYFTTLFYILINLDTATSTTQERKIGREGEEGTKEKVEGDLNLSCISFYFNYAHHFREGVERVVAVHAKLVLFHALFSWATLRLMGSHLVYLSTLLSVAAVLLPFVGTWSVSLLGAAELWLLAGRPFDAIVLVGMHLLASQFVDPIMLGDMGGHHHPLGLSVVGGLYVFGIEGIFLGPFLVKLILEALSWVATSLNAKYNGNENEGNRSKVGKL